MAKVFFSYSHKDEGLRDELEVHLSMLKRQGLIEVWHDRRIRAGENIHTNINENLEQADIILLLVSAHFLASDYCFDREMMRALEKHEQGTAKVVPIILHPCDWHSAPFGNLNATPKDGKPISMFANQAQAFALVTQGIRSLIETLGFDSESHDAGIQATTTAAIIDESPRSSNLRVKQKFTDQEIDDFIVDSFEYIARFFEGSLNELQLRNKKITTGFRRVDSNSFTASVYDDGERTAECTIWIGSGNAFGGDIAYCSGITSSRNQYNEVLSVKQDGYTLQFSPLGMSSRIFGSQQENHLSQEGAAELLWSLLIERLQ